MKFRSLLLLVAGIFTATVLYAQTATLSYVNLSKPAPDLFGKLEFRFNGQKLNPKENSTTLFLNPKGFDTLLVKYMEGNKTDTVLCKCRPGTDYVLGENPCSFWEMYPVGQGDRGVVEIRSKHTKNNLFAITADGYLYRLGPGIKPVAQYISGSAMCLFASFPVKICRDENGEECIAHKHFLFLHREWLVITYDAVKGTFTPKIKKCFSEADLAKLERD